MKNLKERFWRLYYRITLGEDQSQARIKNAMMLGDYLNEQSAKVGIGRNYDTSGQLIRGWHKRSYHPAPKMSHPLLDRYPFIGS